MSSRQLAPPRLPDPPQEITQIYMDDLVRTIQTFIENETNPGEARATKIVLTEMPTSDTGIEAGTLYMMLKFRYLILLYQTVCLVRDR